MFLAFNPASQIQFEELRPEVGGNWFGSSDFSNMIPLADKHVKNSNSNKAIFKLFSWGNSSNRDEWVYDLNRENSLSKAEHMVAEYNEHIDKGNSTYLDTVKWSESLKKQAEQRRRSTFDASLQTIASWRPFFKSYLYADKMFNDRLTHYHSIAFGEKLELINKTIMVCGHKQIPFTVHSICHIPDAGYSSRATQMCARHRYSKSGEKIDNITDWALNKFVAHYGKAQKITKDDIFHYVYCVLHDPVYRKAYAINLKHEFPRIPFYPDFAQFAAWGKALMNLHIGYEEVEPWSLERLDTPDEKAREAGIAPKAMLKADKENGIIRLDSETQLSGIPPEVWDYKLGNRSGLEWILDQYKEKKPRDLTIRKKFNTYRFADYKEKVVDLLMRVTRVSFETVTITKAMSDLDRNDWDASKDI